MFNNKKLPTKTVIVC